jgi:peptidoglycan/LPS O-acetylase OafA/YrhL
VPAPERLDILDGLRGIAILLVVWYHLWLVSGQAFGPLSFVAQAGYLGVELFFFISGFCLYYPFARAAREGRSAPATGRFFERRLLKIVPSYLLALFAFAAIYHAQFTSPQDAAWQLASHLTFLHTLSPHTFGAISGPLWTIGVEVQFYLLFPLIVPWFRRSPVVGYAILLGVSETYRILVGSSGAGNDFWWMNQLPAFFDVFGAGMFAAWALPALRARAPLHPRAATIASGTMFALALTGLAFADHDHLNDYRFAIGPLCIALALPTFFAAERWRTIVASRALVFLSAVSYNLYLWHLEITVWVHALGLPPLLTIALALPLALALAALITYRFERPILQAGAAQILAGAGAAALRLHHSFAAVSTAVPAKYAGLLRKCRLIGLESVSSRKSAGVINSPSTSEYASDKILAASMTSQ